mmetsp:Transcript_1352/g.3268  ORF Transcript_1352/g.3268 Transcript_1352/m.3268 type:complete len:426 (+) Transcript_1352:1492-2769(+)
MPHHGREPVCHQRHRDVVAALEDRGEDALGLGGVGQRADVVDAHRHLAADETGAEELLGLVRVRLVLLVPPPDLGGAGGGEGDAVLDGRDSVVLHHQEVPADHLNNLALELGRGSRGGRGAHGRHVVLPDPEPALLGEALGLVEQLSILGELGAPVDNLAEANLQELLGDVPRRVLQRAVEVVVLVHPLQQHLDVAVEEAGLDEVLRLVRKRLREVLAALLLGALEARARHAREEDRHPLEPRQHVPAHRPAVAELLDDEGLGLALESLKDLLRVVAPRPGVDHVAHGQRAGVRALAPHPDTCLLGLALILDELLEVGVARRVVAFHLLHLGPSCGDYGGREVLAVDEYVAERPADALHRLLQLERARLPDNLGAKKLARRPREGLVLRCAVTPTEAGAHDPGEGELLLGGRPVRGRSHHDDRVP